MALSRRQQEAFEEFRRKKEERLNHQTAATPTLTVVLWGPSDGPEKDKVDQIEAELLEKDYAPILSKKANTGSGFHVSQEELVDAELADTIVVFPCSPGPAAEVSQFGYLTDIARKMYIFLPERAREGYVDETIAQELEDIRCYVYEDIELTSCSLKTQVMGIMDKRMKNKAYIFAIQQASEDRRMQ